MKRIPPIKTVMTAFPFSVEEDEPLDTARELMGQHEIHHLPVTKNFQLVGILHEGDLSALLGDLVEPSGLKVHDAYTKDCYIVDLNERLDNVLMTMANRQLDSVLITRIDKLVGVFTVTDACRYFAEHLREPFAPNNGDDAA